MSGGTDGRLNLWRISSVSSAPLLELGDEEIDPDTGVKAESKLASDAAIRTPHDVSGHEDSVVAAAWSAHSAWVYASLSYPGKVVVCTVPSSCKYKVRGGGDREWGGGGGWMWRLLTFGSPPPPRRFCCSGGRQ